MGGQCSVVSRRLTVIQKLIKQEEAEAKRASQQGQEIATRPARPTAIITQGNSPALGPAQSLNSPKSASSAGSPRESVSPSSRAGASSPQLKAEAASPTATAQAARPDTDAFTLGEPASPVGEVKSSAISLMGSSSARAAVFVVMRGFMHKKGSFRKSWKLRYFVLSKDKLEYYTDMSDSKKLKGLLFCVVLF